MYADEWRHLDRGIKIVSIAEIQAQAPAWARKLWDIEWELIQDIPAPTEHTRITFEEFKQNRMGGPWFDANAWALAKDGERWVGLSVLYIVSGKPDMLSSGLTGVIRPYRRQGIATALKLRNIAFARQYGAKTIETTNEENNPMYLLNRRLGFQPRPAMLTFEKQSARRF